MITRECSLIEAKRKASNRSEPFRLCEGFRMPAATERFRAHGGRRTKTSKGGNRDEGTAGARLALWGFERCGRGVWEAGTR
jgi:hypothetical protein